MKNFSKQTLSKSRLLRGLQCEKNLYLHLRHPELEPKVDAAQQAIFDLGMQVGIEARKRFPGGVLIDAKPWEQDKAALLTRKAMDSGALAIYEATFIHEGVSARVDVLARKSVEDPWSIIEVKASTSVKDEHLVDVAIQHWLLSRLNIPIRDSSLMRINPACTTPDLSDLFIQEDVTEQVLPLLADLPGQVSRLRQFIESKAPPAKDIGPHCKRPYECPFLSHCFDEKGVPDLSIFDLPYIRERAWELYRAGIIRLDDPKLDQLTPVQARMIAAYTRGERFVDRDRILAEIQGWKYPLHYLDFETVNPAIPAFPGTSPYQHIPFQFSCHVQFKSGGELIHFEYLHDADTDPREPLVLALLDSIASEGSIVSYNKGFEAKCIEALASRFPVHAPRLRSMIERLVDPLPLMREAVYDQGFRGSFSIKTVAPALLGEKVSYDGMTVGDGGKAQLAYAEMVSQPTPSDRKRLLRGALLEYCRKDTLNMVLLVQWLEMAAVAPRPLAGD